MSRFIMLFLLLGALLLSACQQAAPAPAAESEEAPASEAVEEPAEEAAAEPEATEEPAEEEMAAAEATEEPAEEEMASASEECRETYEGETLTIYQQAGLTGPLASILGDGFINGSADAVQAVNDGGGVCGVMLEIRLEDSQYNPEQEIAIYEQFRVEDPKPLFILTYGSGATVALKDRVVEDQIVNVAAGLNAEAFYNPADGWTVGVAPIYSDQFAGFIHWVDENWEAVKPEGAGDEIVVGVIGWASAYGAGATTPEALAFAEERGITVLPLEEQPIDPAADVTGQLQNLLVNGANVIYIQSLSFGPVQVVGTLHALGFWDQVVVATNNWGMNRDVLNILGDNAPLAAGLYGVFPYGWWNDESDAVQQVNDAFAAGGYPDSDRGVSYLTNYGLILGLADVLRHAINDVGLEGLDGEAFFSAMKEMGTVDAGGVLTLDVRDGNRAPSQAQIRQAQVQEDGSVDFVVVENFFPLPDTRPSVE